MALLQFNAANVAPSQALEVMPAGWYNAKIIESEMKPTSKGDGAYLALTLEILDGPYVRRKLFDRLNLQNKNQQAVDIAYGTLSAICHATNVIQVQDSGQLHGIPMQVKIKLVSAEGQYEAKNEVTGYKAIEGPMMTGGMPPGFAPAPAQQATAPQPAWNPQQPPQGWAAQPQAMAPQQPQAWNPPAQPQPAPAQVYQQPAPAQVYQQPQQPQQMAQPAPAPAMMAPPPAAPAAPPIPPWARQAGQA